jgi:glutamate dehydrogenase (NADP+)
MLKTCKDEDKKSIKGKKVCVSGSGNVAQFCVEKLIEVGALPITMSDSNGYIIEPNGITKSQLEFIKKLKNEKRGRIKEYAEFSKTAKYFPNKKPWGEKCDIAIPCACENEILIEDAKSLKAGGCWCVTEGANMPSSSEAIEFYLKNGMMYGPAKAANAGGVATSGLEMTQNSIRLNWTKEEVLTKLEGIMKDIHKSCYEASKKFGQEGNLQIGANVAGFIKVADAMIAQGCV